MLSVDQALALLKKNNLDESRIAHSRVVSDFAFDLATRIHAKHPQLDVDPGKVRVAALLHDIGRSAKGDHEIRSVEILVLEGQPDIAAIVMHGSMYEISILRGEPDSSLLPQTLENKIVAYSDARCKDKILSLQERSDEILKRRSLEEEKVKSVKMGMKRYFEMEKELLELAQ